MDIAYKIRRARLKKGYSQDYMACQLELSTKTYSNLESGKSKIDINRLINISDILEINVADLLNITIKKPPNECKSICDFSTKQSYDAILKHYIFILKEKDNIIEHLSYIVEKQKKA